MRTGPIDTRVIGQYLRECSQDRRPHRERVGEYIRQKKASADEIRSLMRWTERANAEPTLCAESCRGCGATVMEPSQAGRATLGTHRCDRCETETCVHCRVHPTGPRHGECLCRKCAQRSPRVPPDLEHAADLIAAFHRRCAGGLRDHQSEAELTSYIATIPDMTAEEDETMRRWQDLDRNGSIRSDICEGCGGLVVSKGTVEQRARLCPGCAAAETDHPSTAMSKLLIA